MAAAWTAARVTRLEALWQAGLSASAIAATLSAEGGPVVTRNAVLGQVHRLKLKTRKQGRVAGSPLRAKPVRTPDAQVKARMAQRKLDLEAARQREADEKARRAEEKAAERAAAAAARAAAAAARAAAGMPDDVWAALPGTVPLAMMAHRDHQCRWPIGDPIEPGFAYCGQPVAGEGRPYCATHAARAYRADPVPSPKSHYRDHSTRPAGR